jgi:hypothetical protein
MKVNQHYVRDEGRRVVLETFLPHVLKILKGCPDQERLATGIGQFEQLVDALINSGSHPVLENWALERRLRSRYPGKM